MDLSTPTTAAALFATLRESIIDGGLPAGTHLPELELARRHGVARSTVREAISGLVNRGLAVRRHNAGARVCTVSAEDLRELYELRECLEGMACRLAAVDMSDAAIASVRELLGAQENELTRQHDTAYIQGEHDLDFHCRLAAGSGNRKLEHELDDELYDKLRLYRRQYGMVGPRARPAYREHQQIVDAIADRDPEMAEMLMRRHIRASLKNIEQRVAATETLAGEAS
ncbi:MAG: GntR family transcriptional regulator [Halofilum sp. (in: g-proteobacteria)]